MGIKKQKIFGFKGEPFPQRKKVNCTAEAELLPAKNDQDFAIRSNMTIDF